VETHLVLAESIPGSPLLPPSVTYALFGRGISPNFLGGRPHPSLCCCHGHILSLSILEWWRVRSCCFPRRLPMYFPLPCVQHQRARMMIVGDAPSKM